MARDDFRQPLKEVLSKRAAHICSNPDCRCSTVAPSLANTDQALNIGVAAHITAASVGGPRYDKNMPPVERSSIENAIFLCSNCATMIDKNNGTDYTVAQLKQWKADHDTWVRTNLNKKPNNTTPPIQQNFHVSSNHQTGGITAAIVNMEKQPEKLGDQLKSQILSKLPDKTKRVLVLAAMGNIEAEQFAAQIQEFLFQQGYTNLGSFVGSFNRSPTIRGIVFDELNSHILVGSNY